MIYIDSYRFKYDVIEFTTNKNGTFSPIIATSDASTAIWSVNGEANQKTNNPSFTLDGTERTVTLIISDFSKITSFISADDGIKGNLDLSLLTGCSTFNFGLNTELTSVINPISSTTITSYTIKSAGLTGTLDMSTFSALGGIFEVDGNTNLTAITHAASSIPFTRYYVFDCNIIGTLDVSMLSNLGGAFIVNNNSNLTAISNPTNSNIFTYYRAYSCDLTGTLDMSTLTGFTQYLEVYSNPNLTDINNPVSSTNITNYLAHNTGIGILNWANLSGNISYIYIYNCAFTSAESDENIVLIDTNITNIIELWMHQDNAALTDGSATGFDGLSARTSLEGKGVSVLAN